MAEAAKQKQITSLRAYVAKFQALLLEDVFTDLLVEQPTDPHAFLIKRLLQVTPQQQAALHGALGHDPAAAAAGKADTTAASPNASANGANVEHKVEFISKADADPTRFVRVQLRLTLVPGQDIATKTIAILKELRQHATSLKGCLSYDIHTKCAAIGDGSVDEDAVAVEGSAAGEEPVQLMVLQLWRSQEALDEHHASPQFALAGKKMQGLLASPPSLTLWGVVP